MSSFNISMFLKFRLNHRDFHSSWLGIEPNSTVSYYTTRIFVSNCVGDTIFTYEVWGCNNSSVVAWITKSASILTISPFLTSFTWFSSYCLIWTAHIYNYINHLSPHNITHFLCCNRRTQRSLHENHAKEEPKFEETKTKDVLNLENYLILYKTKLNHNQMQKERHLIMKEEGRRRKKEFLKETTILIQHTLRMYKNRWISLTLSSKFQIRKIMVFLKGWLWSLGIIDIALWIEIWMIPPTKSVHLRVWIKIRPLETI